MKKDKKLLVLLYSYYPQLNANAICADKYIQALNSYGYDIDVFTIRNNSRLKSHEYMNNVRVYRFDNWYIQHISTLNKKIEEAKEKPALLRVLIRICALILRLCLHLYDFKNIEPINDNINVNEIVNKGLSKDYDCIIAFSFPFVMPFIGKEIKYRSVKNGKHTRFIVCEFDPFAENNTLSGFKKKLRISVEREVYKCADKIIVPPEMEHSIQAYFKDFESKVKYLTFPTLDEINHTIPRIDEEEIQCLYVGNFYKDIRNPEAALELLSRIRTEKVCFHIYGGGWYKELDVFKNKMKDKLQLHGYQGRECVLNAMGRANIMLSVGNTITNQMPSKIFELIALGKPIIHFYRVPKDSCIKYLERYPLALLVNEKENQKDNIKKIEKFIEGCKDKQLTFLESVANLEEYVSTNVIAEFLDEIIRA